MNNMLIDINSVTPYTIVAAGAWLSAGLWMDSKAGEHEWQSGHTRVNSVCVSLLQWWLRANKGEESGEEQLSQASD